MASRQVENTRLSSVTDSEEADELSILKSKHDEAYLYVSQGLSYEEQEQYTLAKEMYEKGLKRINDALCISCDKPYCIGPKWDSAKKMQNKMRQTVLMIDSQLRTLPTLPDIEMSYMNRVLLDRPPSYEEACGESSQTNTPSVTVMNGQFENGNLTNPRVTNGNLIPTRASKEKHDSIEVEEIFVIPDGVQLFYVSSEGRVTAQPSSLHIYKFIDPAKVPANKPPAWLQVDSWIYPLIPGRSPSLYSSYGAYMFPDFSAEQSGSAIGIILPDGLDASTRKTFEFLLLKLTSIRQSRLEEEFHSPVVSDGPATEYHSSVSEDISSAIVAGAELLSVGLTKGAEMTGSLLHKGASLLKESLNPEDKPVPIDPRVQQGLKIARDVSGVAVKVSGYVVNKLGEATLSLARRVAPHLREQGTKMFSAAFNIDEVDSGKKMDGVLVVTAGGLQGFSTLYMGLETAARILASSLLNETVEVVNHKYGKEVGVVVDNTLTSVGNLAMTTHNVSALGIKAVAKKTAKDTGKEVLKDFLKDGEKSDDKPQPS